LLAHLIDQRLERSLAQAELDERGLTEHPLVLVACEDAGRGEDLHHLHHVLDDAAANHLMLSRRSTTYVLMLGDPASLEVLSAGLPPGSAAGVSDPFTDPDGLPAAQRQARWALRRAQERRLALVRHSDDLGGSLFLPATREDSYGVGRRVLGQLIDYDAEHGTELVQSLRAFLEENRSWQRASARLHIHKQTLVYRIARIEAVTGRSLSNTADVAELWLALQAAAASALIEEAAPAVRDRPGC
jgi:purine catabolism regulator